MRPAAGKPREFTGWHMSALMAAFFATVIGVNVTMAWFANSSWTGFVVKNSYVASQEFNGKAAEGRAQAALGWMPELAYANGRLSYAIADRGGTRLPLDAVTVVLRRPTSDTEDRTVRLAPAEGHRHEGAIDLADGQWIVEIDSEAGLDHPYRDVRRVLVTNGILR